nr:elongation factor Ts [Pseudomonadota bacterium]
DPDKKVADVVKDLAGELKAPVVLKGFARFALGEGIEKEQTDFAAEVAAAAGAG